MNDIAFVLDASALLAVFQNEAGAERVAEIIDRSVVGAVNLSEVVSKLQDYGVPDVEVDRIISVSGVRLVPFDTEHATIAGRLRRETRPAGLSLGDRACLALGKQLGVTVLTGDRIWATLDLGISIELIR